jgi:hypothetical protein
MKNANEANNSYRADVQAIKTCTTPTELARVYRVIHMRYEQAIKKTDLMHDEYEEYRRLHRLDDQLFGKYLGKNRALINAMYPFETLRSYEYRKWDMWMSKTHTIEDVCWAIASGKTLAEVQTAK